MLRKCLMLFLGLAIFNSCNLREREIELDKKLASITEKEQQVTLREQALDFREQQLNEREQKLDSTTKSSIDSLSILHPELPGVWNVKMVCSETSCQGSAVGDTKNEVWEFSFHDNGIIASATSKDKMVRVYTGTYSPNGIKLGILSDSTDTQNIKMNVRLQSTADKLGKEMEGEREIIQPNGCRILYTLQLKKQ